MNACGIGDPSHFAAKGIDFLHEMALCSATYRWVA
jgi:hypothetical protein